MQGKELLPSSWCHRPGAVEASFPLIKSVAGFLSVPTHTHTETCPITHHKCFVSHPRWCCRPESMGQATAQHNGRTQTQTQPSASVGGCGALWLRPFRDQQVFFKLPSLACIHSHATRRHEHRKDESSSWMDGRARGLEVSTTDANVRSFSTQATKAMSKSDAQGAGPRACSLQIRIDVAAA